MKNPRKNHYRKYHCTNITNNYPNFVQFNQISWFSHGHKKVTLTTQIWKFDHVEYGVLRIDWDHNGFSWAHRLEFAHFSFGFFPINTNLNVLLSWFSKVYCFPNPFQVKNVEKIKAKNKSSASVHSWKGHPFSVTVHV